jgi:hypothetical protein
MVKRKVFHSALSSGIYPEVVMVFVFVLNVIVSRGVLCDVEPTGTAFAKLLEYILAGPPDEPRI